jgi:Tfp pilus assembly protein PilP
MKRSIIIVMALFLSLPAWGQIHWPWQKAQPAPAKPAPAQVNRPPVAAPVPAPAPAPKSPVAAPAPQGAKNAPQPAKVTPAPPVKNPTPVTGRAPVPVGGPAHGVKTSAPQPVSHARRAPQKGHHRVADKSAAQAKANTGKPEEKASLEPKVFGKGLRDPFVSPVIEHLRGGSACRGTGRQCLEVGDITLNGVVRSGNGNIAVVTTGEHTYFLRENDPLANGSVERINRDSIVLREHYQDDFGHPASREITRKIGTHAG